MNLQNQAEVSALLRQLQVHFDNEPAQHLTTAEWAKQWMSIASAGKSYAQQSATRNAMYIHILPYIGCKQLNEVSFVDAAEVMANVADFSYSLRSKVLVNMRAMFNLALKSHLIFENPCADLKAGKNDTPEKAALTPDQQAELERRVKNTRAETYVLIALYTGLRRSEILALDWSDIDLCSDTPTLQVRRSLRWEHNRPIVSSKLKSKSAYRTIPLPSKLCEYLICLPKNGKYVFGGENPLTYSQFKNLWNSVKKQDFDFVVTPHLLRHTYITRLILGNANIKHVQYLAGHSSVQITLKIYTHLIDNSPAEIYASVNRVFNR